MKTVKQKFCCRTETNKNDKMLCWEAAAKMTKEFFLMWSFIVRDKLRVVITRHKPVTVQ